MKLKLGFSPCPNDTFIFDALVNGKIDTEGIEFEAVLEDVETLNRWALEDRLDITKLSFPAYFKTKDRYALLNAGSALGKGVGPLLVSRGQQSFPEAAINDATVVLPGVNTTAHLLFSFAYPDAHHKSFGVFHEIEDAVVKGTADLGVIIHENRFTYQDKGLAKVTDLGEYWEQTMKVPIPLGGIVIKRSLGAALFNQVNALIRKSLQYAFDRYPEVSAYVKAHAQAMSEEVMRKHIDLYVNNYSLDLGSEGRAAVDTLAAIHSRLHTNA
ncbi:1,4-dihydroxy-6-naphthoate synthase [Niabella sp.]|uniref:1,4-dihydroxy-6-naphthoate synthase n=1 Tax=Niabella sp. TaxID=1962976 RepID=UPI00260B2F22|nr:1,4-dihydroxy-6-naphthoate synthase [Niabella sp.]